MGLGEMAAGAAMNQLQLNNERKRALKGRNPEQQSVIKYFLGSGGGCLSMFSSGLTDEQYEGMVMSKAKATDFRAKALGKIGLDESQVNEIEPIHFEGYLFENKSAYAKPGTDVSGVVLPTRYPGYSSVRRRCTCISTLLIWMKTAARNKPKSTSIKTSRTAPPLQIQSKRPWSKRAAAKETRKSLARTSIQRGLLL